MTKLNKYAQISTLWLDYKEGIRNYILKKVRSKDTADDLAHEVLIKVYQTCCSEREIINVKSWLYQIAHNTSIDFLKKEKQLTDEVPELTEEEVNQAYREATEWIEPLIRLLPEKYAVPLQLSDLEGLKQSEVAERLNLSLTAAKSRIQRARVLLKEKIMECCEIDTDEQGNLMAFGVKKNCAPLQNCKEEKKCE